MKTVKCYGCGVVLNPVVDDCYNTVVPNDSSPSGKEIICENCHAMLTAEEAVKPTECTGG